MPTFDRQATSTAPAEEVWKLLYDPPRFPEWWAGIERVELAGATADGASTSRTGPRATPTSRWPRRCAPTTRRPR